MKNLFNLSKNTIKAIYNNINTIIECNSEKLSFYIAKKRGEKVSNYLNQKGYSTYIDSENFLMLESDNLTNGKQKAIRRLCYLNNTDYDTYYTNN